MSKDKKKYITVREIDGRMGIQSPHEGELKTIEKGTIDFFMKNSEQSIKKVVENRLKGSFEEIGFDEDYAITLEFFPELTGSYFVRENKGLSKKSFCVADIYPGSVTNKCLPRVVLYPERCQGSECFLEELSKSEALSSFLPHSMLVFDKETSKKHFDILFDLITSVETYKLKLGSNVHVLPELVASIL